MTEFSAVFLPDHPSAVAPDGSAVRILLRLSGGSMAHFTLMAGEISSAIRHKTVEEIWYVLEGRGEMWRKQGDREEVVSLVPGLCLTIPLDTAFQFRAAPDRALVALAVTMPPWIDDSEAMYVGGYWEPTVDSR